MPGYTDAEWRDLIASVPSIPKEWQQVPTGQETRVVSETGGAKGSKLARFDLIPFEVLWELAEHYGKGCAKYDERNWQRGYPWSLSIAALMRHLTQFLMGEDIDEETGTPHIVAVAWHAFALRWFMLHKPEFDDRDVA